MNLGYVVSGGFGVQKFVGEKWKSRFAGLLQFFRLLVMLLYSIPPAISIEVFDGSPILLMQFPVESDLNLDLFSCFLSF